MFRAAHAFRSSSQRKLGSSDFDAAKTLDPSFRWDDGEAVSKVILLEPFTRFR
jgi:hypothetical protein